MHELHSTRLRMQVERLRSFVRAALLLPAQSNLFCSSRSPHDRSPEASKQEIHRLRRIVDLLTTRISELEYFRHPPSHAYPHYHQPHYLQTPPSTASTSFDRHSLPSFPPAPPSTASTSFDPHSFPTFPSAESLPPYGRSHSWDLEVDADGVEIAQRVEQRRDVAAWAMREYQRTLAVGERSARAREGYERA